MINIFKNYSLLCWHDISIKPDDKKGKTLLVKFYDDYLVAYYVEEKDSFYLISSNVELPNIKKWAYLK